MATTVVVSAAAAAAAAATTFSRRRRRPFANRNLAFTKKTIIRCTTTNDDDSDSSVNNSAGRAGGSTESGNLLLKSAWYASELLGIAASFFRVPHNQVEQPPPPIHYGVGFIDRSIIVDTIKQDFQRSYFVTGAVTVDAYEDDCEFADPAGSFKGVARFKRNCTNFGSLIHKSNMKLMKWQDFEDKGIGHWRFSCTMSFPWKPILSATGYTEYYLSKESGKVYRHVEHWNVPKMALFKQLLKPRRGVWGK